METVSSRTGAFSVNREAPIAALLATGGAVIPHYVRNHGAVPARAWGTHTVDVSAPGAATVTLTMDQLVREYPAEEVEVTMACDGNRRQELNTLRHSQGFDWGPAAVSTARWKGAMLRTVLQAVIPAHVLADLVVATAVAWVHFEGSDELVHGPYGTSIPLARALDPTADVLLAYEMNGARLERNHGFPLRTILPGCVGGRTVKWLRSIRVAAAPSKNWYHLHDNRMLRTRDPHGPDDGHSGRDGDGDGSGSGSSSGNSSSSSSKGVGPVDEAADEDTVLTELNVNAVILTPGHGAELTMADPCEPCHVAGYTYAGGGRKVVCVETSLDGGETWQAAHVAYPAGYRARHGGQRWWVMARWSTTYPRWKLAGARELGVRAWDSAYNTQPERPVWNLLGMMNNCWYRVRIVRDRADCLRIVHPVRTEAGAAGSAQRRGWMEEEEERGRHAPERFVEERVPSRTYTWAEVARHRQRDDCWTVIDGKVYDLTDFMAQHPGGTGPILAHAGTDVSELFAAIHAYEAHVLKAAYVIGYIGREPLSQHVAERPKQPQLTPDGHRVVLTPQRWVHVSLVRKAVVTHDTRRFTFALPTRDDRMWLPCGRHINLAITVDERRMVVRPYTPVRPVLPDEDDGTFDLVVKLYFPTEARPGGEMTMLLDALPIGGTVGLKGPEGAIAYLGRGDFEVMGHFFHCTRVNFVVGGTGLTPALAVARAVLAECGGSQPGLNVRLVFANKTADDILCLDELHTLEERSGGRFDTWHVLSDVRPDDARAASVLGNCRFGTGFIDEGSLRDHCFPPAASTYTFVCGPPAMVARAVLPALTLLGFDEDHVFEF